MINIAKINKKLMKRNNVSKLIDSTNSYAIQEFQTVELGDFSVINCDVTD